MKWSEHKQKWINRGVLVGVALAAVVALFYGCRAEAAETWPGMPLRTNRVVLCWDMPDPLEDIDYTRIYIRHTLPPDMPLTNVFAPTSLLREEWTGVCGTNVMNWTPAPGATNGWTLLMEIPNKAPDGTQLNIDHITLTNTWAGSNLPAFFAITAKNVIGESTFSNVAWIPRPVQTTRNFQLLSLE